MTTNVITFHCLRIRDILRLISVTPINMIYNSLNFITVYDNTSLRKYELNVTNLYFEIIESYTPYY